MLAEYRPVRAAGSTFPLTSVAKIRRSNDFPASSARAAISIATE
jgi:hypothetical protein